MSPTPFPTPFIHSIHSVIVFIQFPGTWPGNKAFAKGKSEAVSPRQDSHRSSSTSRSSVHPILSRNPNSLSRSPNSLLRNPNPILFRRRQQLVLRSQPACPHAALPAFFSEVVAMIGEGENQQGGLSSKVGLAHPMDPHKPNFSELLPEAWRPYPAFEGWFLRILDPGKSFSAAVILATNYASGESQVTILFSPGKRSLGGRRCGGVRSGRTYAVAVKTKDAGFKEKGKLGGRRGGQPEGFEWEANGVGRIVFTPHVTDIDFTVEGYHFKAHFTKEMFWDAHNSQIGPEGWARYVSIIPTHWYVYSLGSSVEYSFTNLEEDIRSEGSAFGHVEKNWGQAFPAGHVWLQAFSSNNTVQVCCAGAYFELAPKEKLDSPYIFVLGYRSPNLQLDFRSNDVGIVFRDVSFAPLKSSFSIAAVGPSHTVELKAYAPYDTFSPSILAPVTKLDWKPACRESYLAIVEIEVYKHVAWGIPGTRTLVETQKLEFAALEFGEDLLSQDKSLATELVSIGQKILMYIKFRVCALFKWSSCS